MSMNWYFIRHGQMTGDPHARMQPPVQGCLSLQGQRQAARLGQNLSDVAFSAVFASPLGRAIETAQVLKRDADTPITIRDWLIEWQPAATHKAADTGRREDHLKQAAPLRPEQAWKTDAGEGALDMAARIVPGWIADLQSLGVAAGHGGYMLENPEDQRSIAWVAHGGSLAVLLAFVLGINFQPYPPLCFSETGLALVSLHRRADVWYPMLQLGPPEPRA